MENAKKIKFESFLDLVNDRYKAISKSKGVPEADIKALDHDQLKAILGILGLIMKKNIGVQK